MSTNTVKATPRRDRPFSWQNLGKTIAGGYVPLLLATMVVFVPLLWMMLSSLKAPGEIVTTNLTWLPKSPSFQNYADAASTVPFARFFLNSVIVTVIGSTIKCVLAVFTAYALVFVRFPFKRVIFLLILVALMVPPQVSVLPNYVLIAGMGGLNTYWGIILPGPGNGVWHFPPPAAFPHTAAGNPGIGGNRRSGPLAQALEDRCPGVRAEHRHRGFGDNRF
ncbi:hypothetical protein StoSoilB13_43950 (plasmid) [Arthrobacter sp. StoSoilB13]|nr:hypothetical protein StoSoilB13_43950 [Arthrobacter sp. StoSoilB13]